MADLAANSVYSYPYRMNQHPVGRLFRQLDKMIESQGAEDDETIEQLVTEAWPGVVEARLEGILAGYEVPDSLWKPLEPTAFFRLVYRLRPVVKRLTNSFLQMTTQTL